MNIGTNNQSGDVKYKGLTPVELFVVIAIVLILKTILFPTLS